MSKQEEYVGNKFLLGVFLLLFGMIGVVPNIMYYAYLGKFVIEGLIFPIIATGIFIFVIAAAAILTSVRQNEENKIEKYVQERIKEEKEKWSKGEKKS